MRKGNSVNIDLATGTCMHVLVLLQLMPSFDVKESTATIIAPCSKVETIWQKVHRINITIVTLECVLCSGRGPHIPQLGRLVTRAGDEQVGAVCTNRNTVTLNHTHQIHLLLEKIVVCSSCTLKSNI